MRLPINGTELDVEVLGDPQAPVLIAHHGAPGIGSKAEPKASFGPLADTFRVIVFDARGSGHSADTPPYTHEQWAADVDAIRDWAGVESVVMAGGSYGGMISLEYAIRYPKRVRALVLRDTAANDTFRATARHRAETSDRVTIDMATFDRNFAGQLRDNDDFRAGWRAILPLYDFDYDPASIEAKVNAPTYHYQTHNYAFSTNLPAYDITDRLGDIDCPTLITVGRHDWITPVEASEELHRGIPGAELIIFERSGHSPQVEEHDAWLAAVRDFLRRAGADRE